MSADAPLLVHATCVAIDSMAVLLRGPSGSGKSDLALRLIDGGARLVSDDRTALRRHGRSILAAAPASIAGRLEVRGLGIVALPGAGATPLGLVLDLIGRADVERLPDAKRTEILGLQLPLRRLWPFAASAAAQVRLAVGMCGDDSIDAP